MSCSFVQIANCKYTEPSLQYPWDVPSKYTYTDGFQCMISVVYRLEQWILGSMVYSSCHVLCLQIPKQEYSNFYELAVQIVLTTLRGFS